MGLQEGLFKSALKPLGLTVTPTAFNAGPDAVSALFSGSLDITYIGPSGRAQVGRRAGLTGSCLARKTEVTRSSGLQWATGHRIGGEALDQR